MSDIQRNKSNVSLQPITVSRQELPVSCPREEDTLWNQHPRVFLPIEKTGKANCPYCGKQYILVES